MAKKHPKEMDRCLKLSHGNPDVTFQSSKCRPLTVNMCMYIYIARTCDFIGVVSSYLFCNTLYIQMRSGCIQVLSSIPDIDLRSNDVIQHVWLAHLSYAYPSSLETCRQTSS